MKRKYTFKEIVKLLRDRDSWNIKRFNYGSPDYFIYHEKENIRYIKGSNAVVLLTNDESLKGVHEATPWEYVAQIFLCWWLERKFKLK